MLGFSALLLAGLAHGGAASELPTPQRMVDIFVHGEAGFPCWRVPAVVLAPPTGLLFAFAEARNGSGGDGCIPHTPAGLACLQNTSTLNHCNMNPGPRSLALKTRCDSAALLSAPGHPPGYHYYFVPLSAATLTDLAPNVVKARTAGGAGGACASWTGTA